MNLELLRDPLPSDIHDLGNDYPPAYVGDSTNEKKKPNGKHGDSQASKTSDNSSHSSSESDEEETQNDAEPHEADLEMEALLRENSESEDSSEEDIQNQEIPGNNVQHRGLKKPRGQEAFEGPVSTIAILLVACATLRIPVLNRDFGL